jgi:hypothetical protein
MYVRDVFDSSVYAALADQSTYGVGAIRHL